MPRPPRPSASPHRPLSPRVARVAHASGRALAALTLVFALGCSDVEPPPGPPPPEDTPYKPPATSVLLEDSPVRIRREVMYVRAPSPPKNPVATAHAETPPELDFVRVVRYRLDTGDAPPQPARAIAVLMPGFLGGAGSYDALARALVRRGELDTGPASSPSPGHIEAWAIDRRANLLEDQHGLDVAEVRGDPELAKKYYFSGQALEGKSYAGVRPPAELAFQSEWGLAATVSDLHAVMQLVPAAERKGRVVLVGHSLGASIAEAYAAWDFAGTPGYDELAGLVLVDGTSATEGDATPPLTEAQYKTGYGTGLLVRPGLDKIRAGEPYYVLPLLGSDVYPVGAILALRTSLRPTAVVTDPDRDQMMRVLLGLRDLPEFTSRAALGFSFDRAYDGLSFVAVSCGAATGGPVEPYTGVLGDELLHPTDPSARYDWIDYDQSTPTGNTALGELARSWFLGPSLDFAEWYFPNRLSLDAPAAGTLTLKPTDWPFQQYGLRASHGAALDLPIFVLASALVGKGKGDVTGYDRLRALVDKVPLGPGRPHAGLPRTDALAWKAVGYPQLTHIDPILGADTPVSQASAWYAALRDFVLTHSTPGGVVIPVGPDTPTATSPVGP